LFTGSRVSSVARVLTVVCWAATLAGLARSQTPTLLVDRVGDTGFLQLQADSFRELSPREQQLGYWLSQAAIAIHPIIFDQESRFGLRQKRVLEMIVAHSGDVDRSAFPKILAFTKLFWANRGNHNETTAQKFLPDFTFEELRDAGLAVIRHGAPGFTEAAFLKEIGELKQSLFDPAFEPMITWTSCRPAPTISIPASRWPR
jgi:dipeptidyl-peptidase III